MNQATNVQEWQDDQRRDPNLEYPTIESFKGTEREELNRGIPTIMRNFFRYDAPLPGVCEALDVPKRVCRACNSQLTDCLSNSKLFEPSLKTGMYSCCCLPVQESPPASRYELPSETTIDVAYTYDWLQTAALCSSPYGITVVISPLRALMDDQFNSMGRRKLKSLRFVFRST